MTTPPAVIVTPYEPPRRPRRQRPRGWRLKIARFLRKVADWLAPLPKPEKSTPTPRALA